MIRAVLESPFRGSSKSETRQNIIYAQLCLKDSRERGESPFASHLLFTQVTDESFSSRKENIEAGFAWLEFAQIHAFYLDLGISAGMSMARDRSPDGVKVEYRRLNITRAELEKRALVPFMALGWVLPDYSYPDCP